MLKRKQIMRATAYLILLLFFALNAQAQFGVNGKYLSPQNDWQISAAFSGQETNTQLYDRGWSAGVDYWFRLKNFRVEFLPELNYTLISNSTPNFTQNKASIYSLFFNVNVYFLDFAGDCDCPTWSKEGPTLKKGLFLQLSPGLSYWDAQVGVGDDVLANRPTVFSIGAGLGFDLGISDLVTITPMVNARFFPNVSLQTLSDTDTESFLVKETASPLFISGGLRLGFRLDTSRY